MAKNESGKGSLFSRFRRSGDRVSGGLAGGSEVEVGAVSEEAISPKVTAALELFGVQANGRDLFRILEKEVAARKDLASGLGHLDDPEALVERFKAEERPAPGKVGYFMNRVQMERDKELPPIGELDALFISMLPPGKQPKQRAPDPTNVQLLAKVNDPEAFVRDVLALGESLKEERAAGSHKAVVAAEASTVGEGTFTGNPKTNGSREQGGSEKGR